MSNGWAFLCFLLQRVKKLLLKKKSEITFLNIAQNTEAVQMYGMHFPEARFKLSLKTNNYANWKRGVVVLCTLCISLSVNSVFASFSRKIVCKAWGNSHSLSSGGGGGGWRITWYTGERREDLLSVTEYKRGTKELTANDGPALGGDSGKFYCDKNPPTLSTSSQVTNNDRT